MDSSDGQQVFHCIPGGGEGVTLIAGEILNVGYPLVDELVDTVQLRFIGRAYSSLGRVGTDR